MDPITEQNTSETLAHATATVAAMTLNPTDTDDELPGAKTLATTVSAPKQSKFHRLAHGYVRFKQGAPYEEKRLYWQRIQSNPALKEKLKRPDSDCWLFTNKHLLGRAFQLYGSQVSKLVDLLPEAYEALLEGDASFQAIVSETRTQRLTLEVNRSSYTSDHYTLMVVLKKYYKPDHLADDEEQDWLRTSAQIQFEPEQDDPDELLDYMLRTSHA